MTTYSLACQRRLPQAASFDLSDVIDTRTTLAAIIPSLPARDQFSASQWLIICPLTQLMITFSSISVKAAINPKRLSPCRAVITTDRTVLFAPPALSASDALLYTNTSAMTTLSSATADNYCCNSRATTQYWYFQGTQGTFLRSNRQTSSQIHHGGLVAECERALESSHAILLTIVDQLFCR